MRPPSGCRWCGIGERDHFQQWKPPAGWPKWERPTDDQIKARMYQRQIERLWAGVPSSAEVFSAHTKPFEDAYAAKRLVWFAAFSEMFRTIREENLT